MDKVEKIKTEIERRKSLADKQKDNIYFLARSDAYAELLNFIDTLEVKEVDLDKEIKKYIEDNICGYCVPGVEETAKYFFELGLLKAQKGE